MRLGDLLSRADELTLQDILGSSTVRLLAALDESRAYNKYIRELVLSQFGEEGLLLDPKTRDILIDLLREDEARLLYQQLGGGMHVDVTRLFTQLKNKRFRRGARDEEILFQFFHLVPPAVEQKENKPDKESVYPSYPMFNHQRVAADETVKLLNTFPNRVLLHMPTGSGKTRTTMNVICQHLRNHEPTLVVWLATTEELCEQASEEFIRAWSCLGNREVAVYRYWGPHSLSIETLHDGLVVIGLPKIVRTAQSGGIELLTRLAVKNSLVVMDEAHQATAPTYRSMLEILFNAGIESRLLGLSATPGRTWNNVNSDAELANFFNRRKVGLKVPGYSNPVDYLVSEGYLAQVNYQQLLHSSTRLTREDLEKIAESTDIPVEVLDKLGEDDTRNLKIVLEAERLASRHTHIILFAPSVGSADMISCILNARGTKSFSVTGRTETSRRRLMIEEFKVHDTTSIILCNYGVLTTGFDAPKTSAVIIARPTISLVLYSQMVGRAIRGPKAGGNTKAEVTTVIDTNLPGFKSVSESFSNWEDVWE